MTNEPARLPHDATAVTPSDTAPVNALALYVGSAGNVAVVTTAAQERQKTLGQAAVPVVFNSVPAGAVLPVAVARVMATGTTASGIVALK